MKKGIELIIEERYRQITTEGWTQKHDSFHMDESLALAAASYAIPENSRVYLLTSKKPNLFPFEEKWWKPTPDNRIKELVKAGALIVAEIDRLQLLQSDKSECCNAEINKTTIQHYCSGCYKTI